MNSIDRKVAFYLPFLIIIPFIIISFYNHPALDDWWYAEVYKQNGFIGAQQYWYNNYTARFFSNFTMTIAPLSFKWIKGYKVLPVIFLLALFGTMLHVGQVFFNKVSIAKTTLALWFSATYLLIQRDYFECLYWLSANVVYQYTMLFWLLHLTFIYELLFLNKHNKVKYIFSILLTVAVIGSNETLGGLVLLESALLLFYSFKFKKFKSYSILLFITVIISWIIMFMAPGNWKKIHGATHEHIYTFYFLLAVKYSIISVGYYSVFLLKQLSVWCLIILSIPLWKILINNLRLHQKKVYLLLSVLSLIIALTIYFISIYPTGILIPPLRVTNIAIVFLFAGIALFMVWVSENFKPLNKAVSVAGKKRSFVMIATLLFAIITPTKFHQLLTDITSAKANNYNKAMYNRYNILKNSNAKDTCYIPALTNVPRTIVATDVSGPVSENIGVIFGKSFKVKIVEPK